MRFNLSIKLDIKIYVRLDDTLPMIIMKKLFSILVVLLSVLCFLGGEKGVLAESNSLETFRGYVNNDGKSSESRLGINNIYIDDNSQTIVGYCFNIKKQYPSMYGDRYTKYTNVTAEQMKENSSSTLEDAVLYDSVMKVLYNGYPNNGSSIQQKYQLTDDQFRGITQLVIWKFTDSYTGYSFSSDNVLIDYTVKEVTDLSGYQSVVSGSDNNYTITNTHVPEIINLSGTKTWDDNNNQDGIRPESIVVHLLANGVDTGQTKEVSQTDNWTYRFENLPKYQNGQEVVYTVSEDSVGGYETIISEFNITNSHTPDTTEVFGTKTWNDNDDQDGKRPNSSTVNLLANGTKVASQEVTADTNWTYTFLNLAKYANGSAITYAVTEDSVDNYTVTINGYDVTNNYTPGKTSLTVTKVWDDSDDQDGFVLILLMSNYMLMAKNLVML